MKRDERRLLFWRIYRCFRRPECREFVIASRADRGCAFFKEPTWTEFYLRLHCNALGILDTKIPSSTGSKSDFYYENRLRFDFV